MAHAANPRGAGVAAAGGGQSPHTPGSPVALSALTGLQPRLNSSWATDIHMVPSCLTSSAAGGEYQQQGHAEAEALHQRCSGGPGQPHDMAADACGGRAPRPAHRPSTTQQLALSHIPATLSDPPCNTLPAPTKQGRAGKQHTARCPANPQSCECSRHGLLAGPHVPAQCVGVVVPVWVCNACV
jgi:hypothetical protein